MSNAEVLNIFESTGALLKGHFVLRSGLHSGHFFQCARVCEHLDQVEKLARMLLAKVEDKSFTTVLSPAMGGLVIGRGGRVNESIEIIRGRGGIVTGVAVLVDRSEGKAEFGVPLTSLLEMSFPTYKPDEVPASLRAIAAVKPGS